MSIPIGAIFPFELKHRLESDSSLAVIDVRTPAEFEEAHVAEAQLRPLDRLDVEELAGAGISKEKPVYILCQSGGRASKAAQQLAEAGFQHPTIVTGGTAAWIEAGLPVIQGTRKTMSLERQVRIAAGTLVLSGVLLGFFLHPAFFVLSGFVGGGLIFAGLSDWCGMGLLLAKAPWNQR